MANNEAMAREIEARKEKVDLEVSELQNQLIHLKVTTPAAGAERPYQLPSEDVLKLENMEKRAKKARRSWAIDQEALTRIRAGLRGVYRKMDAINRLAARLKRKHDVIEEGDEEAEETSEGVEDIKAQQAEDDAKEARLDHFVRQLSTRSLSVSRSSRPGTMDSQVSRVTSDSGPPDVIVDGSSTATVEELKSAFH